MRKYSSCAVLALFIIGALSGTAYGDATAPTVTITSPTSGQTIYGTFPIRCRSRSTSRTVIRAISIR
jgi:hypothetical protein